MRGRALAFGGCVVAASFSLFGGLASAQNPNERNIDVDHSSHAFSPPSLCVGSSSPPFTFTISNTASGGSGEDLHVTSISRVGDSDFTNTSASKSTIPAGETATFKVTFTPTTRGTRDADLTIHSDDPDTPSFPVSVTGTGIDRRIAADRPTVSFGNQRVDTRSPNQTLLIRNPGLDSVTVTDIALHGAHGRDFIATVPGQPFTIKPGDVRTVTLAFQPSAAGARRGSIEFISNACGQPSLRVALVGTGVVPHIVVNPGTIDAGASPKDAQSPAVPVSVSNDGGAALKITAIQILGPDADDFELLGLPVMPTTVPPAGSFVFNVRMTPSALGLRTATISIISDDPDAPTLAVPLSGTGGTASPSPSPSPKRTSSPSPRPTASGSRSTSPQALGAPGNDSLAVGLVIGGVVAAFVGLMVLRRFVASSEVD